MNSAVAGAFGYTGQIASLWAPGLKGLRWDSARSHASMNAATPSYRLLDSAIASASPRDSERRDDPPPPEVTLDSRLSSPFRFYYLHNFLRALRWVRARYADMLTADEIGFIDAFECLPVAPQALFVRMTMRRGPLFRSDKLAYPEIGCPLQAASPLQQLGWLTANPALCVEELFSLLTVRELDQIPPCKESPLPEWPGRGLTKSDRLAAWMACAPAPRSLEEWHPTLAVSTLRHERRELCDRLRLMFFGNLHQDWSEFVLADLGVLRYEPVVLEASCRAFRHRRDLEVSWHLHHCRDAFYTTPPAPADIAGWRIRLAEHPSDNAWLEMRRAKLQFRLGQACERNQDWPAALAVYAVCDYPGARHRYIRVLERSGNHERAHAQAVLAAASPENEAEAQVMARMVPRLARALGRRPDKATRAVREDVVRHDLVVQQDAVFTRVELCARHHLGVAGASVHYVENTLINSLLGLLCWPAIFSTPVGAFFHPYQRGPADLGSVDFVERRQALFDDCLAQLDTDTYLTTIRANFVQKHGIQSPFVSWGLLDETLLDLALQCLPAPHLRLCFERILADIMRNRTGLPDLIRFWPQERRYEMIEVKGPGDRLQDNQRRWLSFCAAHEIPVAVCHVAWSE